MSLNNETIWNKSILVFDSCSIIRLYEWHKNKSLELKDIFDCKTQDILLLEHIKEEVINVTKERLEQKKGKYFDAFNYILQEKDQAKALKSLMKQCDGYKFSIEFLKKLEYFVNGQLSNEDISQDIEFYDMQDNLNIEMNDIKSLLKDFFSREFTSNLTKEQVEEKYDTDLGKNLPGYKDKNKDKNKFGDYIIINQLVEVANSLDIDIIFITADEKPDWYPYNKKLKQREVNTQLVNWFASEIVSESKVTVITLSQMLLIARNYISDDVRELVDEQIIYTLVSDKYDEWYPEDLINVVSKYIEEDSNIQNEIEDAIDCCLDNLLFGESELCEVEDIEYCIDDGNVLVTIYVDFYLTLDTSAHCGGEDIDLGSPSCHFSGKVIGKIPIEWESNRTGAITLGTQLEEIEIESIEFLDVSSLYEKDEPDEEPEYEEPEYEEPEYEELEYEEPEYEEPEYEEPEYEELEYEEPEYEEPEYEESEYEEPEYDKPEYDDPE